MVIVLLDIKYSDNHRVMVSVSHVQGRAVTGLMGVLVDALHAIAFSPLQQGLSLHLHRPNHTLNVCLLLFLHLTRSKFTLIVFYIFFILFVHIFAGLIIYFLLHFIRPTKCNFAVLHRPSSHIEGIQLWKYLYLFHIYIF